MKNVTHGHRLYTVGRVSSSSTTMLFSPSVGTGIL